VREIARQMTKRHVKKTVSVAAAMAFVATIMMESHAVPKRNNKANFDTDSAMIGVDNCSIAGNPAHFSET
jgi:hypothetical protein